MDREARSLLAMEWPARQQHQAVARWTAVVSREALRQVLATAARNGSVVPPIDVAQAYLEGEPFIAERAKQP